MGKLQLARAGWSPLPCTGKLRLPVAPAPRDQVDLPSSNWASGFRGGEADVLDAATLQRIHRFDDAAVTGVSVCHDNRARVVVAGCVGRSCRFEGGWIGHSLGGHEELS